MTVAMDAHNIHANNISAAETNITIIEHVPVQNVIYPITKGRIHVRILTVYVYKFASELRLRTNQDILLSWRREFNTCILMFCFHNSRLLGDDFDSKIYLSSQVALAAVLSMVMILLLLNRWFLLCPWYVALLCLVFVL